MLEKSGKIDILIKSFSEFGVMYLPLPKKPEGWNITRCLSSLKRLYFDPFNTIWIFTGGAEAEAGGEREEVGEEEKRAISCFPVKVG